ncbi:aldehyde dehydrogenase family protein [Megasphaera cerevisiae]|uniref:aldehyde dehydrogenase family protein n=1 Tax=Megasphaera cerevisiae TaxID=39029 RepID=UPI000943CDD3|nr:aldehyde dehydrogenase family protein [Megasphaera cerevisiae]OKY53986.1 aldehyde dehydrogenase [Megasphaera cerevisiae]
MTEKWIRDSYGLYINGQWVPASDGATFHAVNPANGDVLSTCAQATKADVDAAVKASHAALPAWKKTTPAQRQDALLKIADAITANKDKLAMIETLDNGKPIRETANVDVPFAADHFRYFAGVVRTEEGRASLIDENTLSLVVHEPIGVVGQVIPWNFPFLMAAWKLAPALAAGCTIILKPSSTTSLSVLELMHLIEGILPPGVVNVITGKGSKSGQYILDHPDIQKLAFTGSTEIGRDVYKAAMEKLIPATLELGGKSANIFFEDTPWDMAMDGAQLGILFNQGQVCCAGSRIFVQESIYDKFVSDLAERFNRVKVGFPWESDTQMGAQIDQTQVKKILEYIEIGKKEGARLVCGGEKITGNELEKGNFIRPTIFADVKNDMRIAQEEIFGPVVCIIPFKDEADVIALANASEYGLGGAVWTRDINRAIRVARAIETGRMWVNTYNAIPAGAPFGGYKLSGIGRETDKTTMKHYMQTKNIYINLSEKPSGLYET